MLFPKNTLTAAGLLVTAAAFTAAPVLAQPGHEGHDHAAPGAAPRPAGAGAAPRPAPPAAAKPAAKPVKLPAGVVAQVNGRNITRAELVATLSRLGGQPLLREMINAAVVEQEAKRLGVTVTDAEVKQQIADAKKNLVSQLMMMGTPMTYNEFAGRQGLSDAMLEWNIRQRLLMQKTYGKSIEKTVPAMDGLIQASHILVATVPLPQTPGATEGAKPPSDEEAKKKIEGLLKDVRDKKVAFADAAKQNSDDKGSGLQGGALGWFGRGQMDPTFEAAAFNLKNVGDISEPIKSQYGYHIIKLDKKGSAATAAEKAQWKKQQVDQQVQNPQGLQQWLRQITDAARINTNPAAMNGGGAAAAAPARKVSTK